MSELTRSVAVASPAESVFDYVADYGNGVDWDPHMAACRRLDDGPVHAGSQFEVTRHLMGQDMTLLYEVTVLQSPTRLEFDGANDLVQTRERVEVVPNDSGGSEVTWSVQVSLHGPARVGEPLLAAVMRSVADDGTESLRRTLEALR